MQLVYMDSDVHDDCGLCEPYLPYCFLCLILNGFGKRKGKKMLFLNWPVVVLKVRCGWLKAARRCGYRSHAEQGKCTGCFKRTYNPVRKIKELPGERKLFLFAGADRKCNKIKGS
jgi:hypothetical protein